MRAMAVAAGLVLLVVLAFGWMARGPFAWRTPKVETLPADPARLEATVRFLSEQCVPRSYRAPRALGYVDLSDHSSFWDAGVRPFS